MRFKAKRRAATITSESSDNVNENIKKKKSINIKKKTSLSSADIQYIESKQSNGEKSKLLVGKNISVNCSEWLDFIHIDSFQSLLASQFVDINGLCDPTIYSYGQYCDGIGRAVSIFINNPSKNHWATITHHMDHDTYVWQIYDSLNTSIGYFKPFFKSIIPNETSVEVRIMNVQKQSGTNDCGLFALAFATSICNSLSPVTTNYFQEQMREHFNDCLESKSARLFPSK